MNKAFLFNIQRFCLHDGDGIRTTFFFKGCPLSCKWCHNPEGIKPGRQIVLYPEKCLGCGRCDEVCPANSATKTDKAPGVCIMCGACAYTCVNNAREIAGISYTAQELIDIAKRDAAFYEVSGGGVTLSGGEVMAQDRSFLVELASGLKREGLNLTIDTCGYSPFDAFVDILPYTDNFLYDIKLIDNERHLLYTGKDNSLILSNLIRLYEVGANIHIRIPVIEGVNADDADMESIAAFLADNSIDAVKISLLPYHAAGIDKYKRVGMKEERGFSAPDSERMNELAELFKKFGNFYMQIN